MELRSGTLSQPSTSAAQPPPAGTSRPPSPALTTPTAVGSNSIQPPQPWPVWHPSSRQRDPKVFSGLGDEEIEEWLDIYERISTYNRWDNANKLANIIFYFTDVAKTWYLNHETEWHTWEAFTTRAKEIFGRPENRRATAERRLNFRVQQQGESYTAYIEDVLRLCRRANEQMQEGERVRHLLKGISEEAFAMFLNQPPPDVNAVVSGCTRLAEARQHRVLSLGAAVSVPGHLPPVPQHLPSPAIQPTTQDGLRSLIREIVREELNQLLAQPSASPTSQAPIQHVIRNELLQLMGIPSPTFSEQSTPRPSYAEVLSRAPAPVVCTPATVLPPTTTPAPVAPIVDSRFGQPQNNSWRNAPPTCYYCGVLGHIARYCRRRRNDEERQWFRASRYNYDEPPRRYSNTPNRRTDQPPGYDRAAEPRHNRRQSLSPYRRRSSSPMLPASSLPMRLQTEN